MERQDEEFCALMGSGLGHRGIAMATAKRSLKCREIPPSFIQKYAKHARISRFFLDKPDCRERTPRHRMAGLAWLFSGRHMYSPVSWRTAGECNAIKRRGFGHREL